MQLIEGVEHGSEKASWQSKTPKIKMSCRVCGVIDAKRKNEAADDAGYIRPQQSKDTLTKNRSALLKEEGGNALNQRNVFMTGLLFGMICACCGKLRDMGTEGSTIFSIVQFRWTFVMLAV